MVVVVVMVMVVVVVVRLCRHCTGLLGLGHPFELDFVLGVNSNE